MAYDLSGILTGGAAGRSDSISGLSPEYRAVLEAMMAAAPPEIAKELQIMSGYRSPEVQAQLWQGALKKYGSADAARKWVAPPGRSRHGMGQAIDWSYGSDAARNWVRENAAHFGGAFPLAHEPWHMELAGARNGKAPTAGPAAAVPSQAAGVTLGTVPGSAPVANLNPAPASPAPGVGANPLASIIGAISGGSQGEASASTEITPSSIGQDTGSGEAAQAASLMAQLMADRKRKYGLSLTGMG